MRRAIFAACLLPLVLTACQDPNAKTTADTTVYQPEPVDTNTYSNTNTTYTPSQTYSGGGSSTTSGSSYTPTYSQPYGSGMTSTSGSNVVTSTGSSSTPAEAYPATPSYTSSGGSGYTKTTSEVYEPSTGRSTHSSSGSGGSSGRTYVVKKGDTLSEISQKVYGTSTKWKKILSANKKRIPDEKKLRVGTRLVIP